MQDLLRRIVVVVIMAACIGMLFIGGRSANAEEQINQLSQDESWSWPVTGIITDTFGSRHGRHKGLDIAAPLGRNIYAVQEGIVKKSYDSTTPYGNVIFIVHPNGYETVYAHLSKRIVKEGQKVTKGQLIGQIGSTGRSTGPHLHFEIHKGEWNLSRNNAINPQKLLTDEQQLVVTVEKEKHQERIEKLIENLSKGYIDNKDDSVEAVKQKNEVYIVKSGDTLSEIAVEVGVSVKAIMELNHLTDDLIFPDQILVVEKF